MKTHIHITQAYKKHSIVSGQGEQIIKDFKNKAVIVTGGASGMGRLSALQLAERGAKVAIFDVSEENLAKVAAESPNIHAYRCNIADWEEVRQTVRQVLEEHGPVERLTHAAAIMPTRELPKMDVEEILHINNINYNGTVHMVKAVMPDMMQRKSGDLILFGSIAGHVLCPHMGAYSASKAAVNIFGEQLWRESGEYNLRIVIVQPPATDTPLIKQAEESSDPKVLRMGREQGRFAQPEFIVAKIEEFIEKKGSGILRPGWDAKWQSFMRRMFPGLMWKITILADQAAQKKLS